MAAVLPVYIGISVMDIAKEFLPATIYKTTWKVSDTGATGSRFICQLILSAVLKTNIF